MHHSTRVIVCIQVGWDQLASSAGPPSVFKSPTINRLLAQFGGPARRSAAGPTLRPSVSTTRWIGPLDAIDIRSTSNRLHCPAAFSHRCSWRDIFWSTSMLKITRLETFVIGDGPEIDPQFRVRFIASVVAFDTAPLSRREFPCRPDRAGCRRGRVRCPGPERSGRSQGRWGRA